MYFYEIFNIDAERVPKQNSLYKKYVSLRKIVPFLCHPVYRWNTVALSLANCCTGTACHFFLHLLTRSKGYPVSLRSNCLHESRVYGTELQFHASLNRIYSTLPYVTRIVPIRKVSLIFFRSSLYSCDSKFLSNNGILTSV